MVEGHRGPQAEAPGEVGGSRTVGQRLLEGDRLLLVEALEDLVQLLLCQAATRQQDEPQEREPPRLGAVSASGACLRARRATLEPLSWAGHRA